MKDVTYAKNRLHTQKLKKAADLGSIPDFPAGFSIIPVTSKLVLRWLPCQVPDVIGSALGLAGPVSVSCDSDGLASLMFSVCLSVAARKDYLNRSVPEIHYHFLSDSLHKLNKPEQVILFRLRAGHNRPNARMYNKFKVGESEMCPCNADIMTAEHLLQHCRLHDAMRREMWPEPTLLRDKLYGNLEELRRTAAFVRATGISI